MVCRARVWASDVIGKVSTEPDRAQARYVGGVSLSGRPCRQSSERAATRSGRSWIFRSTGATEPIITPSGTQRA